MYEGDRSRKQTLVDYGFRLPSALDNRPQKFDEFLCITPKLVFVSATPGKYEHAHSGRVVEQIVRPTGIVDPAVEVRETRNQIDDLMNEIRAVVDRDERALVTTLTKKMSEDLTDYLLEMGFKVRYLHSEIDTLERIQIIRDLRLGEYDVLVGVNLLREGLDLPEVSLVAILDADKEGFLRGETSLIQTIGRAARNIEGKVLMYADKETDAMRAALGETDRRRAIQLAYNEEHGITAATIVKGISDIAEFLQSESKLPGKGKRKRKKPASAENMSLSELETVIVELEEEMLAAAEELRFEYAARVRDEIRELRRELTMAQANEAPRLTADKPCRTPSSRGTTAAGRDLPWRRTRDPYAILVCEVMAQQTQLARVLPYFDAWLERWPTAAALAAAAPADVLRAWSGLGYNRRALRLREAAAIVAGDGWPRDAAGLRRLPGVGPYTAAAVASFAFGERIAAVDTNVRRVAARIGRDAGGAAARGPPRGLEPGRDGARRGVLHRTGAALRDLPRRAVVRLAGAGPRGAPGRRRAGAAIRGHRSLAARAHRRRARRGRAAAGRDRARALGARARGSAARRARRARRGDGGTPRLAAVGSCSPTSQMNPRRHPLALDRQSIEKRDFPIGRRGYEPAAVDAHLAAVAREVEALKRAQAPAPASSQPAPAGTSLAAVASASVQAIVEAAESSAAAIERDAREQAEQVGQDAARDAQRTRDEAIERSQDHVGKVHEATALMLQRVDAMESELSALVESLRTGANRLNADLSLLSGNMGELYAAAGQPAAAAPPPPPPAAAPKAAPVAQETVVRAVVVEEVAGEPAEDEEPEAAAEAAPPVAGADEDVESARLVALNMALNGDSRDQVDKYLADNYDLSDRSALLDDVYATVEG